MENVLKNIRKNAIKGIIVLAIVGAIPNIGFFVFLNDPEDSSLAWIFLIWAVLMDWLLIKYLIIALNPTKDNIFKKYGSPKKVQQILNDLSKNKIYEDKNLIMSQKYITDKKDFSDLISFNDVLGIHKLHHKKNNITNYYGVILTDKYGFEHSYIYEVKNEKKCDELLLLVASLCPNAEVGYTKQQKQHIKEKREKLPETYIGESEELFVYNNCESSVKDSDKKYPNCGLKLEEDDPEEKTQSKEVESEMNQKYNDLTKLKKLLDKEIISKEEFEKEKRKVLSGK